MILCKRVWVFKCADTRFEWNAVANRNENYIIGDTFDSGRRAIMPVYIAYLYYNIFIARYITGTAKTVQTLLFPQEKRCLFLDVIT